MCEINPLMNPDRNIVIDVEDKTVMDQNRGQVRTE